VHCRWRHGNKGDRFFNEFGIQAIIGVRGKISDVVEKIVNGTLEGSESFCTPGSGKGYGLDKSVCDHPNGKNRNH